MFPMILFWFSIGHGTGGKLFVTVIDVGQGDGILLRGPKNGTYLIDGGSSDVKEVGKYRIEPFLKSQGIGTLDYVLISHGDSDHYSGVEEMITRQDVGVRIKNLVLPATYQQDEALTKLSALAKKGWNKGVGNSSRHETPGRGSSGDLHSTRGGVPRGNRKCFLYGT